MHALGRRPHREHAGVVVDPREHTVGLHRRGCDALVHELAAHDDLRAAQHVGFVVVDALERDVGAVRRERDRRVRLERGHGIDGDGQRLEAHVDELGGVERMGARVGDDDRDGIADEAHDVDGQGRAVEDRREHRVRAHRADPEIGRGEQATTPGAVLAAAPSIDPMRACASGERTKATHSWPMSRSSTNLASPRSSAGSSVRSGVMG